MQSFRKVIIGSCLGTILEWYDFSLFAYLSPTLSKLFFPAEDSLVALLYTYGLFAIGYFARPIGAVFFGHLGDRWGRKKTLILTILLMAIPTFLIGLLPTYSSVGVAAPILLLILRVCQGFSAGGESTGASLFTLECVDASKRGFWGGFSWSMAGVGMLLGSFAAMMISQLPYVTWAWRIPFLLGLLTGVLGYFLRKNTLESIQFSQFTQSKKQRFIPLLEGWRSYKKELFIIIGLYSLSAMITYLVFVFMSTYATQLIGLPSSATGICTCAFIAVTCLVMFSGRLADQYGKERIMLLAALAFALFSYPLFIFISNGSLFCFSLGQIIFVLLAALFQSGLSALVFDLVPTSIRYSIIGVGYNISYSIIGGTAPFIATYLVKKSGQIAAPGWYLMMGGLVASLAAFFVFRDKSQTTSLIRCEG